MELNSQFSLNFPHADPRHSVNILVIRTYSGLTSQLLWQVVFNQHLISMELFFCFKFELKFPYFRKDGRFAKWAFVITALRARGHTNDTAETTAIVILKRMFHPTCSFSTIHLHRKHGFVIDVSWYLLPILLECVKLIVVLWYSLHHFINLHLNLVERLLQRQHFIRVHIEDQLLRAIHSVFTIECEFSVRRVCVSRTWRGYVNSPLPARICEWRSNASFSHITDCWFWNLNIKTMKHQSQTFIHKQPSCYTLHRFQLSLMFGTCGT